jgi:hypothetical protein
VPKLILFGEASLRRALTQLNMSRTITKSGIISASKACCCSLPRTNACPSATPILCKQRRGGLLRYYSRAA